MPVTCLTAPDGVRNGWTRRHREALLAYVDGLAGLLRLADWRITVDLTVDADADTFAQVTLTEGRREATIVLNALFLELEAERQRDTLVHELMHLHLNPIAHLSGQLLDGAVSAPRAQMHARGMWYDLEVRVDVLADAFGALVEPPSLSGAVRSVPQPPGLVAVASD